MPIPTRPLLLCCLLTAAPALLAAEPPFPVAEVQRQTLPDEQVLDGVVEAVNQSTVSAQTAGQVEDIMVDVNDFVPAGTPDRPSATSNSAPDWTKPRPACAKPRPATSRPRPSTNG